MIKWVRFRLSKCEMENPNGSVFNDQSPAESAKVGPFSMIKWVRFRLTNTLAIKKTRMAFVIQPFRNGNVISLTSYLTL